jgi:glycine dehydrogenase subunit 1
MRYSQITEDQVSKMLDAIGAESIETLFAPIPESVRLSDGLNLPDGVSEPELLADVGTLAAKNNDCGGMVCFLGGGAYDHFIPTVVDAVAGQSEFLTAYTPYQAEASQGILQLFYEFQTLICQLTGMEVSNASLYEGASATAEAVLMSTSITRRKRVLVAGSVHPETQRVLRTYLDQHEAEIVTAPTPQGVVDEGELARVLDDSVAALVIQSPNFYGCIERIDKLIQSAHDAGALAIVSTDPIACGLLKPPGELATDIVVGEGQALGVPLMYGGPYLGLIATREKYLRKLPGRVVGMAKDGDGRRGFCLALQTREQHIKRERATSNICTNQGLLAVRAAVYMATMGKNGIAEVAKQCFDKAHYAAEQIAALDGYEMQFAAPFFKEFAVRATRGVDNVLATCREHAILGGIPLSRFGDEHDDCFLVAVTERRTREEIDKLVKALAEA